MLDLRILGWACVIGLILLALLFLRLGVQITIQDSAVCIAPQLAGITLCRINPRDEKPLKRKRGKKRKENAPGENDTERKDLWDLKELLHASDELGLLLGSLKKGITLTKERLLRRIVVNRFQLDIAVADGDPMKTTMGFGALSAGVYSAAAALSHLVTMRHRKLLIYPSYGRQTCQVNGEIQIWLRLWCLLFAAIGYWKLFQEIRALSDPPAFKEGQQAAVLSAS